MVEQHKKALEKQLWNIANTLRGNMSADEFRDYILGFIFYKYLSERMDLYADELLKEDGIKFDAIDENTDEGKEYLEAIKEETIDHLGYFLKPNELFHVLAQKGESGEFILEDLSEVLNHIEQSTMGTAAEDDFNGLFDDLDLTSNKLGKTENAKNELISKVLTHLDDIDFLHHETDIDVLGDAYEYLIGQFASGAGKKAGEFYTPPMVSTLLAKLVTQGKDKLKSVYDPTCGSGSLLLKVSKEIKRKGGEVGSYFGQESNPSTYNLARMNMILHGVHYRNFDIQQDDTLEQPHHVEKRFEAVVANPPFSAEWSSSSSFLTDERFAGFNKLPPKDLADYAFIQHMFYQLEQDGLMAVVVPHGVLSRKGAELDFRKKYIQCGLKAVISLPEDIFYGTGIPTCILLLEKSDSDNKHIFFADMSNDFYRDGNKNFITLEAVEHIAKVIEEQKVIEHYSSLVPIEDIVNNDWLLSISRYVRKKEIKTSYNLGEICLEIREKEASLLRIDEKLEVICSHLEIPFPAGCNVPLIENYIEAIRTLIFNQDVKFTKKDGTEYPKWKPEKLSSLLDYKQPTPYLVEKADYSDEFDTPVLTAGKTFLLGYTKENSGIFTALPTIIFDDFTTAFKFVDFPFKAKSSAMKMLVPKNESINLRYIYEAMKMIDFPLGKHKRYWISEYQKETIHMPHEDEQIDILNFFKLLDEKVKVIKGSILKRE